MAFPHSISEKANKSATGACCWSNEAVSLFMDQHHFYDYFHLFGLATIHMPFLSHRGRSLGSVWLVMTFCVKTWLTATTIWLASADFEEKGFKISPRPCQGASVSNCSENGNGNKIDGFSFFLFLLSASKALVLGGQG